MDPGQILTAAINAGGFGVMAAAIFWLHLRSIDQFRQEMKEERAGFMARNALLVSAIERQTAELSGRLERMVDRIVSRSTTR